MAPPRKRGRSSSNIDQQQETIVKNKNIDQNSKDKDKEVIEQSIVPRELTTAVSSSSGSSSSSLAAVAEKRRNNGNNNDMNNNNNNRKNMNTIDNTLYDDLVTYHPTIYQLLHEFQEIWIANPMEEFYTDKEYFKYQELRFLIMHIRNGALYNLADSTMKPGHNSNSNSNSNSDTQTTTTPATTTTTTPATTTTTTTTPATTTTTDDYSSRFIVDRIAIYERIISTVTLLIEAKLNFMKDTDLNKRQIPYECLPRVKRLISLYELSERETDLFELLCVVQGVQTNVVRNAFVEDNNTGHRYTFVQRLAGLSEIEMEDFNDEGRKHVKEGIVNFADEEMNFAPTLRLSKAAVHILLGHDISQETLIKISQTTIEIMLAQEKENKRKKIHHKNMNMTNNISNKKIKRSNSTSSSCGGGEQDELDNSTNSNNINNNSNSNEQLQQQQQQQQQHQEENKVETLNVDMEITDDMDVLKVIDKINMPTVFDKIDSNSDNSNSNNNTTGSGMNLEHYPEENQLEYLEDYFLVIALMIRVAAARIKDEMSKNGSRPEWQGSNSGGQGEHKAGRRELEAKLKVQEAKIATRLRVTREKKLPLPRLEVMVEKLGLSEFEKKVVVLLIGKTISPVVKMLIESVDTSSHKIEDNATVGQILSIFASNFHMQVSQRVHFYRSAKLVTRGLIRVSRQRWHQGNGDLTEQKVDLDRRILDWVVGLDTEINQLVEGSDLYEPKVKLDQVVLPGIQKETLLKQCLAYEKFREYHKKSNLKDSITYGSGLVILLCGASGTGKTMTVNAIAHQLEKRVLMVDFPSLLGKRREGGEVDADLRGLFREAEMSNAILFFDECEVVFKAREVGGDRLLNALLTEIERHEGIVFLATNRPFDIDEAMHRRITSVIEFRPPDHEMRKQIWKVLFSDIIKTESNIDWDAIALKYELSGGFIKNAVLSALLEAIARDGNENPVVTYEDINKGCALQMRGNLETRTFDKRLVPTDGMDSIVISTDQRKFIDRIIRLEKSRTTVFGCWGLGEGKEKLQKATVSVFVGPKGSGKITVARALAFELGKPIKMLHVTQITNNETYSHFSKRVSSTLKDARLMDAILILDGFEYLCQSEENGAQRIQVVLSKLLDEIEAFPGPIVFITHIEDPLSLNFLPELSRRLTAICRFGTPQTDTREKLWRKLTPEVMPLAADVNLREVAQRYEINAGAIYNAIFEAASKAALRSGEKRVVKQSDFMESAKRESLKVNGMHADSISRCYL